MSSELTTSGIDNERIRNHREWVRGKLAGEVENAFRGCGQLALRCAQVSEARRHPRTGQHERKLQLKACDLRRFKRRSVDHRGTHVSGEPRALSSSFLKRLGRYASFTDFAKY